MITPPPRTARPTGHGTAIRPTLRRVLVAALLLGAAGCGAGGDTAADLRSPAASNSPQATPQTLPPAAPTLPTTTTPLPWPVADTAAATQQAAVDAGTQPWLLDPTEVALAYAAAAHGWSDAEAGPSPAGTEVDVRNAAGQRRLLTLRQPARSGSGGIWVVVTDEPTR